MIMLKLKLLTRSNLHLLQNTCDEILWTGVICVLISSLYHVTRSWKCYLSNRIDSIGNIVCLYCFDTRYISIGTLIRNYGVKIWLSWLTLLILNFSLTQRDIKGVHLIVLKELIEKWGGILKHSLGNTRSHMVNG